MQWIMSLLVLVLGDVAAEVYEHKIEKRYTTDLVYHYVVTLPEGYEADSDRVWPSQPCSRNASPWEVWPKSFGPNRLARTASKRRWSSSASFLISATTKSSSICSSMRRRS